ncbi:hypothetical protein [Microcella sp.]|uniref:hypothetical protein n=1 Tax=Microcella sp. TaxID=1913979 RepID=UPI0025640D1B|nr:hypothetical protein [Microcella sp.]MBX9471046.1 hypothetical protein [Microcella sp.]
MSMSDSTEPGTQRDPQADDTNDLRSVDEAREEAAGDQDDAAETEADEDRTRGYV